MTDEKLNDYLSRHGIKWQFNLNRAPLWGGQFDRLDFRRLPGPVFDPPSLRSMAVLSSRAPPQSPRGFSALVRLYYLARPAKTAMLRRL